MRLSKEQREKLLASPNACPNCKSNLLDCSTPLVSDDDREITCKTTCESCGQHWVEVYTLSAVRNIKD